MTMLCKVSAMLRQQLALARVDGDAQANPMVYLQPLAEAHTQCCMLFSNLQLQQRVSSLPCAGAHAHGTWTALDSSGPLTCRVGRVSHSGHAQVHSAAAHGAGERRGGHRHGLEHEHPQLQPARHRGQPAPPAGRRAPGAHAPLVQGLQGRHRACARQGDLRLLRHHHTGKALIRWPCQSWTMPCKNVLHMHKLRPT